LPRTAVDWRANGNGGRDGAMGSIEAGLDEIFAFWLGDKWLELGGGECVDKAGFGDDEQQDLGAGECGELVGLFHDACFPFGERYMTSRLILDEFDLYLSSPRLLVRLGFVFFIFLICAALVGGIIVDERVVPNGPGQRRWMAIARPRVPREVCALAFAHGRRSGRHVGLCRHRLHQVVIARREE
jgi:hypothetical protein